MANNFCKLDSLLKEQAMHDSGRTFPDVYGYARSMSEVENVVAVVSDLSLGTSKIFNGAFAEVLGISDYSEENSIW